MKLFNLSILKKSSLLVAPLFFWVAVSCSQVQGESSPPAGSKASYDSLVTQVQTMQEELDLLKWGLAKKGLSIDQIRADKDAEEKEWDIPVAGSPIDGPKDAPIMITEFSDFQCPYCARVAPEIQKIREKYPEKVAVLYKHFPLSFHKQAPAAHAASMAAQEQGKFWEYRYALAPHFRNLDEATFIKVAEEVGLNIAKFKEDMKLDKEAQAKIDEDMQLGQKVGVRGTPNFYVNGKKAPRFSPEMIDQMVKDLKK